MKKLLIDIVWLIVCSLTLVVCFPISEKLQTIIPSAPWELFAFFLFVPLFYRLNGKNLLQSFNFGFIAGCLFYFGSLSWVVITMVNYGNMPAWLSYMILSLLVLYLAVYHGLFFLFIAMFTRQNIPLTLVAPFIWVVLEYTRGWFLSGFPWNSLGYSQFKMLPLIQSADIASVHGISFLIILINSSLYDIFFRSFTNSKRLFIAAISSTVFILNLGYGLFRLSEKTECDSQKICYVQGNFRQDEKWAPENRNLTLETYLDLSRSICAEKPDVIVWPEAALPFRLRYSAVAYNAVARLTRECDTTLATGSPDRMTIDNVRHYYNSVFVIDRDGQFGERYDKMHLVPFGEYVPYPKLLYFVDKLTQGAVGNFTAGDKYTVFTESEFPFSVYICYETIFPDQLRIFVQKGARFLLNVTNDAWFGRSAASYQHFSMTVFRAIENRVPIVRAANTGISGAFSHHGEIIHQTALFTREAQCQTIKLPRYEKTTIYCQWGDFFVFICSVLLIGESLYFLRRALKQRVH